MERMGAGWLNGAMKVSGACMVALLAVKYAMLQSLDACTHRVGSGAVRRGMLSRWYCGAILECLGGDGSGGDGPVSLECSVFRLLDWVFHFLPQPHTCREMVLSGFVILSFMYRGIVFALLEDWGFISGPWRLGGLLDGVDNEADLPELEEVEAEGAAAVLPPEGVSSKSVGGIGARFPQSNGQHHPAVNKEDDGEQAHESCGKGGGECCCRDAGAERVTASKQVTPEGWLVYDKVLGVVPYEVLEHWKAEGERRRTAAVSEGMEQGRGERSLDQQPAAHREARQNGGCGVSSADGKQGAPRRALPPVRRPPPRPAEVAATGP